jgi:hypothetical protein
MYKGFVDKSGLKTQATVEGREEAFVGVRDSGQQVPDLLRACGATSSRRAPFRRQLASRDSVAHVGIVCAIYARRGVILFVRGVNFFSATCGSILKLVLEMILYSRCAGDMALGCYVALYSKPFINNT